MKYGVVFPTMEIGTDVTAIRDFTQVTEAVGYDYLLTFDHVLGANPDRPDYVGAFDYTYPFYEPFVLFSYMAAITQKLEFVTGILILPQRQTALVAKQAATLDVLTQGRLRLGVGVGEVKEEFEALNENFRNRGKRQEEQIEVLRLLWSQELVTYDGKYHSIPDAGINPLPMQDRIPIWFGGNSDTALRRMAKYGDGWIPHSHPPDKLAAMLERLREYLSQEGRDPTQFGLDYHIILGDKTQDQLAQEAETLKKLGVTNLCVYTCGNNFTPQQHIEAIQRFHEAVT